LTAPCGYWKKPDLLEKQMTTALPDYLVRHSRKAKNLRIKVTRSEGLCVVVPRDYDEGKIPDLLKKKRGWITEATKRVGETRRFLEPLPVKHLPDTVRLVAFGETWLVSYCEIPNRSGTWLRSEDGKLVISGSNLNRESVMRKLKEWLRVKVRADLFPFAEKLAAKHRLKLGGLMVKSQRTRWASCSARGNLALNTKLLFLSHDLVRYILIHELCHTVHMNHSKEFWRLVASHEPSYKVLDQSLREAWKTVPQWVF
jgi:predicted metal-dependent hydrolase